MKDINLLLGILSARKQFDFKRNAGIAGLIIVIVAVLLGGAYFGLGYLANQNDNKTAQMKSEMANYQEVLDVKTAISTKTGQLESINELISAVNSTTLVKSAFFNVISASLNGSVFLTGIALNEDGSVSIAGKAAARPDITYFVYTLKTTDYFTEVAVSSVNEERKTEGQENITYDFSATAQVKEVVTVG
ncbi:MAG: hypothetical protein GX111_02700 [Clostridiales bacterium]|nr:hypothetical protein [Clostridiales bacterium]